MGILVEAQPDRIDPATFATETGFVDERGLVWCADAAPDFNRHLVGNTPYGAWYDGLGE